MVPISLCDTLVVEDDPTGEIALQASWVTGLNNHRQGLVGGALATDNLPAMPEGDENIVVRAARLLARAAGIRRGVRVRLVKRIPSAAGLGGGSSDAAATLVAANCVWNLSWPLDRLTEVAAQLGSDVPFFLAGGPAACRGRGEKVEPIAGLGMLHFVVVRPPEGLSTAAVYRACQPGKPSTSLNRVVAELTCRNWTALGPIAFNGLLTSARELSPSVGRVLDRLKETACPLVGMSGSGSSCFAIARNSRDARQLARRLRNEGIGRTWTVRSMQQGNNFMEAFIR
ncbi:MAG: 4-(cytidine 5'-diphospho)-2-C-methyl-D-erythritol kinase [Pirellulales bacterium]|nr:4-(cytidine 5'-diphospho)-2-C-methyl-D-erythritol kinase [Pirellulales bacterium]